MSTISQASSPFWPFTQQFFSRNLKATHNYHPEPVYSQKWKSQIQIFGFRSRRTLFYQGALRFEKNKNTEDDIIIILEFLVENIFVVIGGKVFQQHSNGHKLCPSPSLHISVLIRSGIYTVFALNWKEKVSISVQLHIQIHR